MRTAVGFNRVFIRGLILLAIGTLSCATVHPDGEPPAVPPMPRNALLAALGQLPVFITDQTTDGRNIKLRGLVANPFPDPVDGVRVVFRMLAAPDDAARELDRFQKIMHVQLAAGARAPMSWDIQTMYAGVGGSRFTLEAFAIKCGDQVLPLPPDWKE